MDYISINRDNWNRRTPVHLASAFYDQAGFLAGKNTLQSIELELLGDVRDKTVLHLQCHFGQDTLSLARMGARVTGVDLSDEAIAAARNAAAELDLDARFVCCDLYALPEHLQEPFDIVFTTYGTIGWLPDIPRWAGIVRRFLKPGGSFVFVEFHPAVWMYDDNLEHIAYRYFQSDPILDEGSTYAEREGEQRFASVSWNHGLAEVVQSLLDSGLRLNHFAEYDYSPYNCLPDMEEAAPGRFRVRHWQDRVPLVYSLRCSG